MNNPRVCPIEISEGKCHTAWIDPMMRLAVSAVYRACMGSVAYPVLANSSPAAAKKNAIKRSGVRRDGFQADGTGSPARRIIT